MIDIKPTDKIFSDSPNAGDKDCICSRCLKVIKEHEVPIRMWTENEKGQVDEQSKEYRFCEACQYDNVIGGAKNIFFYSHHTDHKNRLPLAELFKQTDKNWSEDFSHENGNYINICTRCEGEFLGHKRRVVCKKCFNHD